MCINKLFKVLVIICMLQVAWSLWVCDLKIGLQKWTSCDGGNGIRGGIQDWLCIGYEDTEYNETTVKQERYGVFQIQSPTYCTYGSKGGNCNKDCRDFLDTYLEDDITCAQQVYNTDRPGTDRDRFYYWFIWREKCNGRNISIYGSACKS